MNEIDPRDSRVAPPGAMCVCGICGGIASRSGTPVEGFKWRGGTYVSEDWVCGDCKTGGNVLRDDRGRPVRLPHVLTGDGFVEVR